MTYLIERDGRSLVNVPRFAADLAAELGGTVLPPEKEGEYVDPYVNVRVGDLILDVSGNHYGFKGKVSISCMPADVSWSERPSSAYSEAYRMPSIRVSPERPLSVIARDVRKRVIDAAVEPAKAIRAYVQRQKDARTSLAQVLADLNLGVPELKPRLHSGVSDGHSCQLDWSGVGHVYLQVRANADRTVTIDRIGQVSLEAFVEIADVLRRHSRKD